VTALFEFKCDRCEQTIALPVQSVMWKIQVRCPDCLNKQEAKVFHRRMDRIEGHLKQTARGRQVLRELKTR
jgi:ribosomal protein S27E